MLEGYFLQQLEEPKSHSGCIGAVISNFFFLSNVLAQPSEARLHPSVYTKVVLIQLNCQIFHIYIHSATA